MTGQRKERYVEDLSRIREEINRLFESALVSAGVEAGGGAPPGLWLPAVDVVEEDGSFRVYVELPGVDGEGVGYRVEGSTVEIIGERRLPLEGGSSFRRMESRYGPFRRAIELTSELDPDGVVTHYERGVLEIRLKKRASKS